MKKTLIRIFALVLTLCTVFSLASCFAAKPEKDLEDAKENLEDANYEVDYVDDEEYLAVNVEAYLKADNDKDEQLTVYIYKDIKSAKLAYKQQKAAYEMEMEYAEYAIDKMELELKQLKNRLKKYEDDLDSDELDKLEEQIEDKEEAIEDSKEAIKEYKKEYVIGRSGKMVWYGTDKAIKKSKG